MATVCVVVGPQLEKMVSLSVVCGIEVLENHYKRAPVIIEDNAFIGSRWYLLKVFA